MSRLHLSLLLLCVTACAKESDRPLGGGGGNGGGGGGSDARAPGSDAQSSMGIRGRLCLVDDIRDPLACPSTNELGGIAVNVGGVSTVTADDGSFAVGVIDDIQALVKVAEGNDGYRDLLTVIELDEGQAMGVRLPAIPDATWESLLAEVSAVETDDTASIVTYLSRADEPVTGAEVIPPSGSAAPFYDGPSADPNDWISGGLTGPQGAAIIVQVLTDELATSFDVSVAAELRAVDGVQVLPGFLSYVPVSLD